MAQPVHKRTLDRVFVLGDGEEPNLCTEDLVAVETYAAAINQVLRETRNTTDEIKAEDLPTVGRPRYVDNWCESRGMGSLSKTLVAERVLRIADEKEELIEDSRKEMVAKLYQDLMQALKLKRDR